MPTPQYEDVYEPPLLDATFIDKIDDLIAELQNLSAPSATNVAVSPTGLHYITEDDAQGALAELDAECYSLSNSLTQKLLIGRSTIVGDNTTNKVSKIVDITATNPDGLAIKGVLLQWLDTDNIVTYADYLNVVTFSATSLTISSKWRTANAYSWQFEYILIT